MWCAYCKSDAKEIKKIAGKLRYLNTRIEQVVGAHLDRFPKKTSLEDLSEFYLRFKMKAQIPLPKRTSGFSENSAYVKVYMDLAMCR